MMKINNSFGTIGVLMGGYSSEREISLKSGKAISQSLMEQGLDVLAIDIKQKDLASIARVLIDSKIDVAFIALHGALGEDGKIQAILEKMKIPYTGSDEKANQVALNKDLAQRIFSENGICVPENIVLSREEFQIDNLKSQLKHFPYVVKPSQEGSSIGISIIHHPEELESSLIKAWQYGEIVLIEKYIEGRELTIGILGRDALPIVEIVSSRRFFDFESKYQKGLTEYVVPAKIDSGIALQLKEQALKAHTVCGCKDFSRVDFILENNQKGYVMEINTIPGFTETSLLPMAALEKGIHFNQLCYQILEMAYGKKKEIQNQSIGC